jgi:tetraacyldisaccharide 4'-kinase
MLNRLYSLLFIALLPLRVALSWCYGVIAFCRNKAYDYSLFNTTQNHIFSICIGNISVGGTGKTPMVAFLLEHLPQTWNKAILSRGYGRSSKGFIEANAIMPASFVGDEPYLIFHKFQTKHPLYLDGNRVNALSKISKKPDVLLLDDGFQHRALANTVNIVLMDYAQPFWHNHLLPWGTLRESADALKRAHIVIVSKCPENMVKEEVTFFREKILQKNKNLNVYFSTIQYGALKPFNTMANQPIGQVISISSIANARLFETHIAANYAVKHTYNFPDHYHFTQKDMDQIIRQTSPDTSIICTEKDFVKLKDLLIERPCYYLPIETNLGQYHYPLLNYLKECQSLHNR